MVGITYVYIDTTFAFYDMSTFFFYTHLRCLIGYLSMTVWTHAVLSVLYACVLYFCICTFSAQLSIFSHGKALSKYTHYYRASMIIKTI